MWQAASLCGDAVVLAEDAPVSVRHLLQRLVLPVAVVPQETPLLHANLGLMVAGREGGREGGKKVSSRQTL